MIQRSRQLALGMVLALAGCSDTTNPDTGGNEGELITTVELGFASGEGEPSVFRWSDPELDGSPVIDPIVLAAGQTYALSVRFLDEASQPPTDITVEVADEAEQHQVFFTGEGIDGPATSTDGPFVLAHSYADLDVNGLPVGLMNGAEALATGSGTLAVTLQHLPRESGVATKLAGLAEVVAESGFGALGGDTDVQVSFELTVQ